ncbi:hypothetical protein PR003_g7918 [Phytophthora rubi]|uniref:Uncharacterized protein n=1 Tax=Phytophthora rubi TaxID=129364 RepID=A0A6A4FZ11_9STRA|nr:hypothetical protein PR003_g7918 [Phytophthora rubi]
MSGDDETKESSSDVNGGVEEVNGVAKCRTVTASDGVSGVMEQMKTDAAARDSDRAARYVVTVRPVMSAVRFVRADREEELEGSDVGKGDGVETGEGASRVAVSAAVCSQSAGDEERRQTGEGARVVEVTAAARPVKAVELVKTTESDDSAEHHDTEGPCDEMAAFATSPWRVRATEEAAARTALEARRRRAR